MSHSEEKQPPSPSDSVLKTEEPVHIESGNARPSAVTHQVDLKKADAAVAILGDPTIVREVTPEENRKVLRKIDFWIMPVVVLVYMLQQLDKSSLSYTSVFGIVTDAHLHGTQYSWLTSIVYIAQLIWQPASSYMLVRFPLSKYLFVHVVMWGVCVASTAAAKNFSGLMAARFFLGLFEATIAPCFITITQMWWKRREQTFRLAMWMAANGGTGMFGSLLTYGLGHIHGSLRPYQVIFLFIGLLTIALSPIVYFVLPDSPTKARFLNKEEKIIAVERLRSNNQGTETKIWKWEQVWDVVTDPKTYLFFIALVLCTIPSGGISAFGPLIIQGFGFDQFHTILFNIPFSALQVVLTLTAGHMAQVLKLKSAVLFFFCLPPIGAAAALLTLGRGPELRNTLLGCYYVVSFFTAIQPMLYTWSAQNTAGHTKKTCTTGIIFVAQCVGNIIGPLLYKTEDKPYYRKGLIANLVCWIALAIMVLVITAYLSWANKRHEQRRIALGKPGKVVDTSLDDGSKEKKITSEDGEVAANEQSFLDLTDRQNEDFIYVL